MYRQLKFWKCQWGRLVEVASLRPFQFEQNFVSRIVDNFAGETIERSTDGLTPR